MLRPLKVATPLEAATVVVPMSVPLPLAMAIVTFEIRCHDIAILVFNLGHDGNGLTIPAQSRRCVRYIPNRDDSLQAPRR